MRGCFPSSSGCYSGASAPSTWWEGTLASAPHIPSPPRGLSWTPRGRRLRLGHKRLKGWPISLSAIYFLNKGFTSLGGRVGAPQPRGGDRDQEEIPWLPRWLPRVTQVYIFSGGRALERPQAAHTHSLLAPASAQWRLVNGLK